ncbi:MAG: DUF3006 domain-containing protein [Ruminococcus sp.]|nr:DUF3006 domain-containing protein [Ruminococcus sp.]
MKRFTVDRIEEDKAVLECENGECVTLEVKSLPKNINEGDVLCFEENSYFLDKEETEKRRQKIKSLMDSIFD